MSEAPGVPVTMLTINGAATYLGVSRRTVYNLIDAGELATVPIPKRPGRPGEPVTTRLGDRRIEVSELEAFKDRNRVRAS